MNKIIEYEFLRDFPDVLTVKEICMALHIGRNAAYKLIKEKKIASFKIGESTRILKAAVIDFLKNTCYNNYGDGCSSFSKGEKNDCEYT